MERRWRQLSTPLPLLLRTISIGSWALFPRSLQCYDSAMASLDEEIIQAAEGISVLVLFGSRAKGTARPDSDLDVAVLPESGDPKARRELLTSLAVALADLAPDGRVDVVFLDEANDVLRQRVMQTGRVLISTAMPGSSCGSARCGNTVTASG